MAEKKTESILDTIIPLILMVVISAATVLTVDRFTSSESPGSKVLVYSMADWVTPPEDGSLTPDQVTAQVQAAKQAIQKASEAGYVVINSDDVESAEHTTQRLLPGMFSEDDKG